MKLNALGLLLTILWLSLPAHSADPKDWDIATDIGGYGLIGVALALPLVKGDHAGVKQAGYSIVAASAIALIGKSTTNQQRPDNSGDDSFPSNHAATAFAAATTLHRRYGWRTGFPAYGVAAFVGAGRVEAEKHYWRDVIVGAAVGLISGWIFTDKFNRDVQLTPWNRHGSSGLMMSVKW